MSKTPLHLQNAFQTFSPRTHPNERDRSRLFDAALRDLVSWWWQTFTIQDGIGIRSRSWSEVEAEVEALGIKTVCDLLEPALGDAEADQADDTSKSADRKGKGKAKATETQPVANVAPRGERIRSAQSLMKRALLMRGSRDMSAQLFTALCRALDIPARLVFSLQPVDWKLSNDRQPASSSASTPTGGTVKRKRGKPSNPLVAAARKTAEASNVSFGASRAAKFKNVNELTSGEPSSEDESVEMEEVPVTPRGSSSRPISISGSASKPNSDAEGSITFIGTISDALRRPLAPVKLRKSRPKKVDYAKSPSPG
jgi:xeroderma pigmentosum group C-complementing protein